MAKRRRATPRRPVKSRRPVTSKRRAVPPTTEPPAIRLREVTIWRKGGRFASASTPGATRQRYIAQVDALGRILDIVELTERRHVIRTVLPGAVDHTDGLISRAIGETNAFTASLGASRVQVTVTYQTPEGRDEAFKLDHRTLDQQGRPLPRTDINNLMVGSIIEALRRRGYRTRYSLQQVDWSRVQDKFRKTDTGGRMNIAGRTQVRRRQEVSDVRIKIEMFK